MHVYMYMYLYVYIYVRMYYVAGLSSFICINWSMSIYIYIYILEFHIRSDVLAGAMIQLEGWMDGSLDG